MASFDFLRPRLLGPALLAALAATGCASLPPDQGQDELASLISARGRALEQRSDADAKAWMWQRLAQPLDVDSAVQIALAQNPRLRVEYARLDIASAEVYDAGRLSNPRLSASILFSNEAGALDQVTFGLAQSFTSLLMRGPRSRFAQAEFVRVQQSVGAEVLALAARTEGAFYALAGAQQVEKMRAAVAKAAGLSADLAQRFFDAGNITRLELSLEQAAASQAQLELLEAQASAAAARAELNALMGLNGAEREWTVTPGLPAPLPSEDALPALLQLAGNSRLDVLAARQEFEMLADMLGITRRFRYLGEVDVGVETERETDGSRLTGPTLSLELPLFNQGRGRVAKAQAQLLEAEARLQELQVSVTNAVQLASLRVANARARADGYRSALIPQREQIVQRTQEQVNYMLVGQFELLRAKREEYDAYKGYLEAVSDYWAARAELGREVGTRLPSSAQLTGVVLDAEKLTRPKGSGLQMDHGEGMKGMEHDMPGMDKPDDMEGMHHDMPGMDKPARPAKDKRAAPSMPPPRKDDGHADMPTGMESHIPAPAKDVKKPEDKPHGKPTKDEPKTHDSHQHGDHQ